ncbi:MAG: tetratricopeptide repeat protein [Muribaculaceae bacterium]|nr:tetratricopeptide repeat protein [Muribaculaceae bacterium]
MTDTEISEIIAKDDLSEARSAIARALAVNPDDDGAYYCLGRVLWKFDRRPEALSAFTAAVRLNPDSPARHALEMGRDVFDFFNPDLLNP